MIIVTANIPAMPPGTLPNSSINQIMNHAAPTIPPTAAQTVQNAAQFTYPSAFSFRMARRILSGSGVSVGGIFSAMSWT